MQGVRRLLPNLKLDLTTFGTERVWLDQQVQERHKDAFQLISELESENVARLARRGNFSDQLTADDDSQMLVAVCWPIIEKTRFLMIVDMPGITSDLDSYKMGHLALNVLMTHVRAVIKDQGVKALVSLRSNRNVVRWWF